MTIIAMAAVAPPTEPSLSTRRPAAADSGFSVPGGGTVSGQAMASAMRGAPAVIDAGAILALQEHGGQEAGNAASLVAGRRADMDRNFWTLWPACRRNCWPAGARPRACPVCPPWSI